MNYHQLIEDLINKLNKNKERKLKYFKAFFKIEDTPFGRQPLLYKIECISKDHFVEDIYDRANEIACAQLIAEGALEEGNTIDEIERNNDKILNRVQSANLYKKILRETITICGHDCGKYHLYMLIDIDYK